MRVRYTIPGWQPTMPRGLAPVRPPIAFREMMRSQQGVPDTDWKASIRAKPKATLAPTLEPPSFPRAMELQSAESSRAGFRGMVDRIPDTGGPAMQALRALLEEVSAFESKVLGRASSVNSRG